MTSCCPKCGKEKKPLFRLCYDCFLKEKQKPRCRVCGKEIQPGHDLCTEHYKQIQEETVQQAQAAEKDCSKDYQGTYEFNTIKFRSKSELIIYLFLEANGLQVRYQDSISVGDIECHPSFIIEIPDSDDIIILEHFGLKNRYYTCDVEDKKQRFVELAKKDQRFHFIYTTEDDLFNLKIKLGSKLNNTPLQRPCWR